MDILDIPMSWFSKVVDKVAGGIRDAFGTKTPEDLSTSIGEYVTGETAAKVQTAYQQVLNKEQFAYNSALQRIAQDFNADQARITREWQERLANSAYQRARADLEKANLNPLLVTPQGSSTPSGATATSPSASAGGGSVSAHGTIGEAIGTIASLMSGIGSALKLKSDVQQAQANVQKTVADTKLAEAQTANQAAQTEITMEKSNILRPAAGFVKLMTDNAPRVGQKIGDWLGGIVGSNTDVPTSSLGGIARLAGIDTSAKGNSEVEKAFKKVVDALQAPPASNSAGNSSEDKKVDDEEWWNDLIRRADGEDKRKLKKNYRDIHGKPHSRSSESLIHLR